MSSRAVVPADSTNNAESGGGKSEHLHYLDWLRVILILGVFLHHAASPFRAGMDWHFANAGRSVTPTVILVWIWPCALPLFLLARAPPVCSLFAVEAIVNTSVSE